MKVKYEFEPNDFIGRGQMIVRCGGDPKKISPTLAYKVGYGYPEIFKPQKICLIAITDGQVMFYTSVEELCFILNTNQFGYRPMTKEEIAQVCGDQGNRFPV